MKLRLFLVSVACLQPVMGLADDWPQFMGPKRDNIWREEGILETFPKNGPKVLWRTSIGGGFSSPSVVNGKVYVTDFVPNTGTAKDSAGRSLREGKERVLCFDAKSGKELWKHEYPRRYTISYSNGPRAAPTVHAGKVYTVGAEGDFFCLDANRGTVLWQKDFQKDYKAKTPLWGFSAHPLIYGQLVITLVGGAEACAMAWDKDTGKEVWRALKAPEPGYGSPSIIEDGGKKILMIWHSESVNALDPLTGKVYWSIPLVAGDRAAVMAPIKNGDLFFVGCYDGIAYGMRWQGTDKRPETIWQAKKSKTGVFPVSVQPQAIDGYLYAVDRDGDLRCVKLATGERLWETYDYTLGKRAFSGNAFLIRHKDRFFMLNEKGELIIAKLSPKGHEQIDRTKPLLEPTTMMFGRATVHCSPAFANKCMFVRNDKELICVSLAIE